MTDRLAEIKRTWEEIHSHHPTMQSMLNGIRWLILEVERLRTIHTDTLATDMDFLCNVRLDAERWQYVREHGFDDLISGPNWDGVWMLGENADAAVDAARNAT